MNNASLPPFGFWDKFSRLTLRAAWLALAAALAWVLFGQIKQRYIYLDEAMIKIAGGDSEMRLASHRILREAAGHSLLDLDLAYWQQRLQNVPRVARAHLQRQAPHALHVQLEEHQPLARWAGGGLIDVYGDRYDGKVDLSLPVFEGPNGSIRNMIEFYQSANEILQNTDTVMQLQLSGRGDWRVFLTNGVILYLGHSQPRARLRLYVTHERALHRRFANVRAVDLRYEHGFSIINDDEAAATDAAVATASKEI